MSEPNRHDRERPPAFSLIRGDPLFRLQQAVGLIPAGGGLGVARRAALLAAVTADGAKSDRLAAASRFQGLERKRG